MKMIAAVVSCAALLSCSAAPVAPRSSVLDGVACVACVVWSDAVEARTGRRVGDYVLLEGAAGVEPVPGRRDPTGHRADQAGGTVKIVGERVGLFAGANTDAPRRGEGDVMADVGR